MLVVPVWRWWVHHLRIDKQRAAEINEDRGIRAVQTLAITVAFPPQPHVRIAAVNENPIATAKASRKSSIAHLSGGEDAHSLTPGGRALGGQVFPSKLGDGSAAFALFLSYTTGAICGFATAPA